MIKFKKNQEIVYDVTFIHSEKEVKVRFVITKSKITNVRKISDIIHNRLCRVKITDDIYNLYRVDTAGNCERKVNLLTTSNIDICMNTIKYVLELNK